jgi:hypothetical protein
MATRRRGRSPSPPTHSTFSLGNLGKADMFDRSVGLDQLIRRIAPHVQTAQRLCDQPRGTRVGPGEL